MKSVTPKKKKLLGKKVLPVKARKKKPSISARDHLLRQMAIRFLVDKNTNLSKVARELKTTTAKLKSFFEDPDFTAQLEERIELVHGVDGEFMASQSKITLVHLYEEMRRREILEGGKGLGDVDLPALHKMIINTQKELRLDTPGAFTSKVGVADLGNLQDRYENSLSGKMHRMKKVTKKKPKRVEQ